MVPLRLRISEVTESATKLPFVLLESMLPRQVLRIQVDNPLLTELVLDRLRRETPVFGMLGVVNLETGQKVHWKYGVEVEIVEKLFMEKGGIRLELKAGRRFSIVGDIETAEQGWTEGRVQFYDSGEQEAEELNGKDFMAVERAILKSRELTKPNSDNMSIIDRWIKLARENEKVTGQIDNLLKEIGQIPSEDEPTERAFWVGALINPIPSMGVAMEIRPKLLTAKTTEQRVQVALDAIHKSIRHMDGTERMW